MRGESALDPDAAVRARCWQHRARPCGRHEVPASDGDAERVCAGAVDLPKTVADVDGVVADGRERQAGP
jgi:hypothetical protein